VAKGSISSDIDGALSGVRVRLARHDERERWDRTMRDAHYLGSVGLVGKALRYVGELDGGEWVALIGWCTAAFQCGARERWIGWPEMLMRRRLRFVVNNARFLILPEARVANLASRVLGLNLRRLSSDWEAIHGHEVLVAETFVDPRRFTGTCYRAAGWEEIGLTRGFARDAGRYVEHGNPKRVFVRMLRKDAVRRLRDPAAVVEKESPMAKLKLDGRRTTKLMQLMVRIPDPRDRKGRWHSSLCLLSIAVCASLAGAKGYTAIGEFAARLKQRERKRLDCRKNPKSGEYDAPSEHAFRDFLNAVDVDAVDAVLAPWYQSLQPGHKKAVAIDGKTLRGAERDGKKVHLLGMLIHGTRIMAAQREVGEKTNEIPEAKRLLENQNLVGVVVTADAMHTQTELAKFLVKEKKADYVFVVKENQPTLHAEIAEWAKEGPFPPSGRND